MKFGNKDSGTKEKMTLDSELYFGKHKGLTISLLIESDIDYLEWATSSGAIELDAKAYAYFLDEKIRREEESVGFNQETPDGYVDNITHLI